MREKPGRTEIPRRKNRRFWIGKVPRNRPQRKELTNLIAKTGKKPFDFVRTQEKVYKEQFKGKNLSDKEWIKVLVEHPKLLQRPIVENGDKAVLGNPPENIESILQAF